MNLGIYDRMGVRICDGTMFSWWNACAACCFSLHIVI